MTYQHAKIRESCEDAKMQARFPYRGTSLIRNRPPPQDVHRALGIVLLYGPKGALFLMSEVPLHTTELDDIIGRGWPLLRCASGGGMHHRVGLFFTQCTGRRKGLPKPKYVNRQLTSFSL